MLSKLKENVVSVADSAVKKAAKIGTSSGRGNNEGDSDESEDGDDYLSATLPTMPSEIPRATGDKQWFGAILGKDGCIYCIPCNANRVLRINPKTGQLSTFGELPKGGWKWRHGALAPNGKIYCVPYTPASLRVECDLNLKKPHNFEFLSKTDALVRISYDIEETKRAKRLKTIGLDVFTEGSTVECKIYALGPAFVNNREDFEREWSKLQESDKEDIPIVFQSRDAILCFDPKTEKCETFGDLENIPSRVALDDTNGTFNGAILGKDGNIYGIPSNAKEVLVIDTKTNTIDTFGHVPAGNEKWNGAVEGKDGLIYCIPSWATNVLVIDPINRSLEFFGDGLPDEAFKWSSGVLAPDNCIYCIPALSKQILKIDPKNRTTTLFGIIRGKEIKYDGGFVGKDGNIYAMPVSPQDGMLCIDLKAAERMEAERKAEVERKNREREERDRKKKRDEAMAIAKTKTCKAKMRRCCRCIYRVTCLAFFHCLKRQFFQACPCLKPKPKLTVKRALLLKPQEIRQELKKRKLDEPGDIETLKEDLLERLIFAIEAEESVGKDDQDVGEESEEELEPLPITPPLVSFGTVPPGFDKWTPGVSMGGDTLYTVPSGLTSVLKIKVNYKKGEADATIVDHVEGSYPEVDRSVKEPKPEPEKILVTTEDVEAAENDVLATINSMLEDDGKEEPA